MCSSFLRYDRKRIQELGPDRACAEWLLRCGGSVRFKNWGSFTSNYNTIPSGAPGQFKIEEIRAVKACITSEGFAYLGYSIILFVFYIDFVCFFFM
jgi:H+-transporting ATP synthase F0 complex subunit s